MFEEFYDHIIHDGAGGFEKRTSVLSRYGKEYWLGYHPDGSFFGSKSVSAFYMGYNDEEHTFMALKDGKDVEIYSCPVGGCFLVYYHDGEDCEGSAVYTRFKGLMPAGKEKDLAVQILTRRTADLEKRLQHTP